MVEAVPPFVGAPVNGSEGDDNAAWKGLISKKAISGDHDQPSVEQDLREAASKGDIATIRVILNSQTKFNINAKNPKDGLTALHYAMRNPKNQLEIVKMLLDKGADPNVKGKFGDTALHLGVVSGDKKVLQALIDAGADLSIEDDAGFTPYKLAHHWGTDRGDKGQYKAIPSAKANAEFLAGEAKKQLQAAFKAGDWKKAVSLIKGNTGIDPKARYEHSKEDNVSLLSYAAGEGKLDVVKALVEAVPEDERASFINKKGSRGRTAMHSAAEGNHKDVYDYLKSKGGKDDIRSDNNNTPSDLVGGKPDEQAPEPEAHYGPPTANMKRPASDTRTAKEIIADSPILRSLQDRHKRWLKNGFEWPSKPDKNHPKPDNPFKGIGDYENDADKAWLAVQILEHIEKYDSNGAVITSPDVGNGRLNGFTKGNDAKPGTEAARFQDFTKFGFGNLKGGSKPPVPKEAPTENTKRPKGDTRSAQQIINDDPLLSGLTPQIRGWLNNGFGGDHPFKGLKSIGGNNKGYEEDADKAYLASRILAYIENYGPTGKIGDSDNNVGNHRIDGFFGKGDNLKANPNTEAARLQDFAKYGFSYLKDFKEPVASTNQNLDFTTKLKHAAYERVIADAKLPKDRKDILENPGKYSTEQKYAARLELMMAYDRLMTNTQGWDPFALRVTENKIRKGIKKLTTDEVMEYAAKNDGVAMQEVLASDSTLRAEAKKLYEDMKKGVGLEKYLTGKDKLEGLRGFLGVVGSLNLALGKNGRALDDNLVVDITKSSAFDDVIKLYQEKYEDPNTLKNLVKEKGEQEAFVEFNERTSLFAAVNAPDVAAAAQRNLTNYALGDVAPDDFQNSGMLNKDGTINEDFVRKALEKIQKEDPGSPIFTDEKGKGITIAQIITGVRATWDGFRNAAKVNTALPKMDMAGWFNSNNTLMKGFGSGVMHAVSAVLGAAISIARSEGSGELSLEAKIAAAGNGIQAFGVGVQAFEFGTRPSIAKLKEKWQTGRTVLYPPKLEGLAKSVMNFGKFLNGSGGLLAGTAGIALGVEAIRAGYKDIGGLFMTQGISNTLTALGPIAEALAPRVASWLNIAYSVARNAALFVGIGTFALALNVAAGLAVLAYGFYEAFRYNDKEEEYDLTWEPTLKSYGIPTGKSVARGRGGGGIRTPPLEPW